MDSSLLATKLRIPPPPRHAVRRERLLDALEDRIADHKLVLLSAPAGYGKTTLLAEWARASRYPIAWLTLGEQEGDPERFLRYLLRAWEAVQPELRDSRLGLLLGAMSPERDAVLTAFINAAEGTPRHTVFVLDDYHLIQDAAVHQALTFLLDHLPPTLHFVLAARSEPPLPLARYRARSELLELRAEDLHFRLEETGEFLKRLAGRDRSPAEIETLQARLEGWAAGLQLVGLALQRAPEAAALGAISGRHRFIADYLSQEVLHHLAEGSREFLLQTSILEQLCGPLCDAVTERADGQELLEALERQNLFLVPLDDDRRWFRYHRLFGDYLRAELQRRQPTLAAELHRRAAPWYLAHDLPDDAFEHALAGADPDFVIRIFERYLNLRLNSGEILALVRWFDSLPADWYATYPVLGLARAGFWAITGDFAASLRAIDEAEERLLRQDGEEREWQLALVTAVRCYLACIQNDLALAEIYADRALRSLRDESRSFRAGIYHALGDTYRRNGLWEAARESYLKVPASLAGLPEYHVQSAVQSVHVCGALADLELQQGRLRHAADYWTRALAAIEDPDSWGRLALPVVGWVHLRLGEVRYEWNDLTAAREHLAAGLARAELGGDARALATGYLLAGRISLTEGNVEAAAGYLEWLRALVEQAPFPDWISRFERFQIELWLAQGRLREAVDWAGARPEQDGGQLATARALIARGDPPALARALALLGPLLQDAEAEGRAAVWIEGLALRALAHWQDGDRPAALTSLERALRRAEPEGYVRLFADLGPPLIRPLQEAHARGVMRDYTARLLAACDAGLPGATRAPAPAEALTEREHEILRLLAAGLTNPEIAAQLFISPETVKKHAANIYGKLGVRRRAEAVARARALHLLD
ncbi:MAG TPA: LuxR C-terminal-related transcriptional regulator [Thermomicrobiaceae bacterium]|nr:LuxR C-terminal-related transcriptional regulator [Thermomicrobiaceae bacterium]